MFKSTLVVCLFALALRASTSFDANLASPSGSVFPGWYNGTGNPNGGFTIDLENGIELGLRAKLRQDPNVIDTPTDIYDVPYGPQLSSPSHAAWNYEFSIDLEPGGVGSLTLGDINASLTITDLTTSATATIDPLTYFNDDTGFGPSNKEKPQQTTDWGAQNSENPAFASFPLASDYNEAAARTYLITLTVTNATGDTTLAADSIMVEVVTPEPATFGLIGIAMLAFGLARRYRRRHTSTPCLS